MSSLTKLLAAAACAFAVQAHAAETAYPVRPILLVSPLAAGSTNDMLARALAPELEKRLGQPVVVENRTGAGGHVAMRSVARAAPDGYTLILGASNTWATNVALYRQLPLDPVKEFVPVAYVANAANTLVVRGDSDWHSLNDLVAALRSQPGRYNFSSGGNGTSQHLGGELLKTVTRTSAVHVPFSGPPQGVTAIAAGQVEFGFYNTPSVLPLVASGRLRALAVTSPERSVLLPQVPTVAEAGCKDCEMGVAIGVLAPAGTPASVVEQLNGTINAIVSDAGFRRRMEERGYDGFKAMSPEQFGAFIRREVVWWGDLVKRSGASAD
jgi:tripartite-type tricarboxylate transporter receptor subunit TctC